MRIFISSVRAGLEEERDSLPGLIAAAGQECVRFEDFGAQPTPSRETCVRGVESSDVYILLLGPRYGHVFPETGQSATHDEWVPATTAGMPRLVFRKIGVEFQPEQEEFAREVGDYSSGVFYGEFTKAVELQAKVFQALATVANQPSTLTYGRLEATPQIEWKGDWDDDARRSRRHDRNNGPYVELHAVSLDAEPRSARQMRALEEQLVPAMRASGALPPQMGVTVAASPEAAEVELPPSERRGGLNEVHASALGGARVASSGTVTIWWTLPYDSMGGILDEAELGSSTAKYLRLIGSMRLLNGQRFALAIGLGGSTTMLSEGHVTGLGRSSTTMNIRGGHFRVEPDESVSSAAFDRGAEEVARELVAGLLNAFRRNQ
jgi:hypothetical protein